MSEWISVEDRLPENCELVLVFWKEEDGYRFDFDVYEDDFWMDWFSRAEHYNIAGGNCNENAPYSHWMSLPKPPC